MSAGAVLRTAAKGVVRRPVGAVLILVVVATATAISLLGLTLLTNGNEAFVTSFRTHHGADVAAYISTPATTRDLAATRHAPGVTETAGPYPALTVGLAQSSAAAATPPGSPSTTTGGSATIIRPRTAASSSAQITSGSGPVGPASLGGRSRGPTSSDGTGPAGRGATPSRTSNAGPSQPSPASRPGAHGPGSSISIQTIVGRRSPAGALDDLTVGPGRWLTGPGQIVLVPYFGDDAPIGSSVKVATAPGKPTLKVVGYAGSLDRFGMGWVTPAELARLTPAHRPHPVEMLYRFRHAATALQVSADVAAMRARLPAGSLRTYESWLDSANQTGGEQASNTAFVLAFGLLGVILAIIVVASLVSGAVVADYRRIGVLKSIGFTPRQVAATYIAQATIPAAGGLTAGAVIGNLWVTPQINKAAGLLGAGAQHVPAWLNVATAAGMLALVALAAIAPAHRAGRLSAVGAITAGQSPQSGRGRLVQRLSARVGLPRPVTLGLAAPLTRPSRAATLLAAALAGATAVLLAVGLNSSLSTANRLTDVGNGQVSVGLPKGSNQATLTAHQSHALLAAIRRQPGTRRVVAVDDTGARINSITALGIDNLNTVTYAGNSSWLNWPLIAGLWYHAPDQLDVNPEFLSETGLHVGQSFALQVAHHPVRITIVGEIYQPNGPSIYTSSQTFGGAAAGMRPTHYAIQLGPHVNPGRYAAELQRTIGVRFMVDPSPGSKDAAGGADGNSLINLLAILIGVLAGLGVLSAVLMLARERRHDLGVFKALGMTPRQTLTTVTCSVIAPSALAAALSIPIAILLHARTVHGIGSLTGSGFPPAAVRVYHPLQLAVLALSGIAIAIVGALIPATQAASTRAVNALHTE